MSTWIHYVMDDCDCGHNFFCFCYEDVSAPFKIFSTLIRGLDSEMALTRKDSEFSKDST